MSKRDERITKLQNESRRVYAVAALRKGGVIAYPTEAVFGLGCAPFNESAVNRLLQLKQRDISKGLISIGADWTQLQPLTQAIDDSLLAKAKASWPGPNTWLFPASDIAPAWITGQYDSIALRIPDHPIARELCQAFGGPIVSTSANPSGQPPAHNAATVQAYFGDKLDHIQPGQTGGSQRPSCIRNILTNQVIR